MIGSIPLNLGAAVSLLNALKCLERNQQHEVAYCAAMRERKKACGC